MSAGDVLLFSRKITPAAFKADPFGTTMCALIHLTTRSKWNHAALDIGDGMMVEATSKGVAVNPIRSSDEIRAIYMGADDFDNPTFACKPCSLIGYYGNDLEEVLPRRLALRHSQRLLVRPPQPVPRHRPRQARPHDHLLRAGGGSPRPSGA
jgi:hypothetical protein